MNTNARHLTGNTKPLIRMKKGSRINMNKLLLIEIMKGHNNNSKGKKRKELQSAIVPR